MSDSTCAPVAVAAVAAAPSLSLAAAAAAAHPEMERMRPSVEYVRARLDGAVTEEMALQFLLHVRPPFHHQGRGSVFKCV